MPSPSYQKNKKHIYKWVANNREKHNNNCREGNRKRMTYYREAKRFRLLFNI
jgi:hypothetical protein